jgi:hypothetical protein
LTQLTPLGDDDPHQAEAARRAAFRVRIADSIAEKKRGVP